MSKKTFEKENIIRICRNHISGILGEALLKLFLKEELIKRINDEYIITERGWDELELIGVDVNNLRLIKGKIVTVCIESDHGVLLEHIGSHLGKMIFDRMYEMGWLYLKDEKRYIITEKGENGLESLHVNLKN